MAAQVSLPHVPVQREPDTQFGDLRRFRGAFYDCLTARADAVFELADAVLCSDGPVNTLVELCLAAQHRRGHGALYDGLNAGRIDIGRLRRSLTDLNLPRDRDGRIVLAVDVSNWLRPDADTSAQRLFCHTYGRGKNQAQMIPGWPFSFVAALESGPTAWTQILDVARLRPGDDQTAVTAGQVRDVVTRLVDAGQWRQGDPDILIVFDAGYDVTRLAYLLGDLPVRLVGRLRSDRVLRFPRPPRAPGTNGRSRKHGPEFSLADQASWPAPEVQTANETTPYGTTIATCWNRLHPRLTHRAARADHQGELPVIEGSLIQLSVDHLPGDRNPKPVWLWTSATDLSAEGPMLLTRRAVHSCADSTSSTPSECSNKPSAGPNPKSATPKPLTAGVGSSSRPHPAPARPRSHRPHPPPPGTPPTSTPTAYSDPSTPRVSEPPPKTTPTGPCTKTQQTRSRTPSRTQKPPTSSPPRRRQTRRTNAMK